MRLRGPGLAAFAALAAGALPAAAAKAPVHRARPHRTHSAQLRHHPAQLHLTLLARPARPVVGRRFEVVVIDAPSGARDFRWSVDGLRGFHQTGAVTHLIAVLRAPGPHTISVRARSGDLAAVGHLSLVVAGRARAEVRHGVRRHHTQARLASAGDPGVTIVDFAFDPGTTTVHVGDTITWTNTGKQPHTATANDNSFNTGILQKGQSGSHTFTKAGTFSYFCQVHPFMKGTIVVLAASTTHPSTTPNAATTPGSATPTSTTAKSTSPSTQTSTQPTQSGSTLPFTGMNVLGALVVGVLLLAGGAALRQLAAPAGDAE